MNTIDKMIKEDFQLTVEQTDSKEAVFIYGEANDKMTAFAQGSTYIVISSKRLFVRSNNKDLLKELEEYYKDKNNEWFGEFDNLLHLNMIVEKYGQVIDNYAPFYTPKTRIELERKDNIRIIEKDDINKYINHPLSKQAFSFNHDVLGMAYTIDDKVVGLVGVDYNGAHAFEIGVGVDANNRHQNIATKLVMAMTSELQKRYPEITPLYSTQFTHNDSLNVASKAGFKHAYTGIMTIKKDLSK